MSSTNVEIDYMANLNLVVLLLKLLLFGGVQKNILYS